MRRPENLYWFQQMQLAAMDDRWSQGPVGADPGAQFFISKLLGDLAVNIANRDPDVFAPFSTHK